VPVSLRASRDLWYTAGQNSHNSCNQLQHCSEHGIGFCLLYRLLSASFSTDWGQKLDPTGSDVFCGCHASSVKVWKYRPDLSQWLSEVTYGLHRLSDWSRWLMETGSFNDWLSWPNLKWLSHWTIELAELYDRSGLTIELTEIYDWYWTIELTELYNCSRWTTKLTKRASLNEWDDYLQCGLHIR